MKLYLIRHAESEANAASDLDNPTYYYDARITQRGVEQAKKLKNRIKNLKFDNYFCSPLTRTLETFSIVFPSNKPVIEPLIREHLYHSCDVGRQPKKLKKEFKDFDFNNLNDFWWNNNKPINEKKIIQESHNDIKMRLKSSLLSIKKLNLQKRVNFFSNLTEGDLRSTYCEAELAVIPSLYEGFGFAAIEAMACGVPLISTSGGALPEVVKDAGIIIPPKKTKEIYNAVDFLLSSPDKAKELSEKALERANLKFSWETIARKLEKVYLKEMENFKHANN